MASKQLEQEASKLDPDWNPKHSTLLTVAAAGKSASVMISSERRSATQKQWQSFEQQPVT